MMLLCMDKTWDKEVIAGARRLYAGAVKQHKGKQKKQRLDKGVSKGRFLTSEASFLKRKRDSVRAAGASSAQQVHVEQDASGLATKAAKEMELQKKRRMTRAVEAAQNGYLLPGDVEAGEAAAKLENKKKQDLEKDINRIQSLSRRTSVCERRCEPQSWNWKSLGKRRAWAASPLAANELSPLVFVSDTRNDFGGGD